jgi:hypothetical protein
MLKKARKEVVRRKNRSSWPRVHLSSPLILDLLVRHYLGHHLSSLRKGRWV